MPTNVEWLLEREVPLRTFFDADKLAAEGGLGQHGDDDHRNRDRDLKSKRLGQVATAIGSGFFWAYAIMMHLLAAVVDAVSWWTQGCPCHSTATPHGIFKSSSKHLREGSQVGCWLPPW